MGSPKAACRQLTTHVVQSASRYMLFRHGQQPNELMVKRLGMFGCTFLVLVHSVKDRLPANSYAGACLPGFHMYPSQSAVLRSDPEPPSSTGQQTCLGPASRPSI